MQNMIVSKTVRCIVMMIVMAGCVMAPLAGFAGIGTEASNRAVTTTTPSTQTVANVPAYPGSSAGMNGTMIPASQSMVSPYPEIPSYLLSGNAAMPYGTTSPYGNVAPYTNAPTYGTYGTYGTLPGMTNPSTGTYGTYPGVPTTPNYGYGTAPGTMYSTPLYGDSSVYAQPYTATPYGQMPQPYAGYQGNWSQQQTVPGYGYPANPYATQSTYGTADQVYNQAMQAYRNQDYWTALSQFQDVAMRFPQSDLGDNAYYWMGEIYLAWKNYPAAIQAFQTVLQSYPTGNKAPDAHVKLGYAYAEVQQYPTAKMILTDVASRYADNKRIRDLATKKLNEINNLYFY